jgi:hypothetical protein
MPIAPMPDLMAAPWIAEMDYSLKSAGISMPSMPAAFSKSGPQNHRLLAICPHGRD